MKINYSNGRKVEVANTAEALEILRGQYPSLVTEDCGDRTLAWRNESEADNDDGANAVAEIVG